MFGARAPNLPPVFYAYTLTPSVTQTKLQSGVWRQYIIDISSTNSRLIRKKVGERNLR